MRGWFRDELLRCANYKCVHRENAPIQSILALILDRVKEGPNKVHFQLDAWRIKISTVQIVDNANYERIMLLLNTKTLTMYFAEIAVITTWN